MMHRNNIAQELHVTEEKIIGATLPDIIDKLQKGVGVPETSAPGKSRDAPFAVSIASPGAPVVGGLRTYLAETIGKGYWDFIEVGTSVYTGITDATYHKTHQLRLQPEELLKIRVICSGEITLTPSRVKLGPRSASINVVGGSYPLLYDIHPGKNLRMVTLHLLPDAFENLGISLDTIKQLVATHSLQDGDKVYPLVAASKLLAIAEEIVASRDAMPPELRLTYINGKSRELLCTVMAELISAVSTSKPYSNINEATLRRIEEARRILASSLDHPPTIQHLARMVGINRTRLKEAFKQTYGATIHQYHTGLRMAEARKLIENGDMRLGEIASSLGFEYASHFTQSVKRQFGVSPKELRQRARASATSQQPSTS